MTDLAAQSSAAEAPRASDSRPVWVIFDIGMLPEYYLDVQRMIALPKGAVHRYDYSASHFSSEALVTAREVANRGLQDSNRPFDVLLVYAQKDDFQKGQQKDGSQTPDELITLDNGSFTLFRLAKLRFLSCERKAGGKERFYFDLEVRDYPVESWTDGLETVLRSLIDEGAVPYKKLVATTRRWDLVSGLPTADASRGFGQVVNRLGTKPRQYANDMFWRVKAITDASSHTPIVPYIQMRQERQGDTLVEVGAESRMLVYEQRFANVEIEAQVPSEDRPAIVEQRSIVVEVDGVERDAIAVSPTSFQLRRFGHAVVKIAALPNDSTTGARVDVLIRTERPEGEQVFPTGPEIKLGFETGKQPGKGYWALLIGVLGVALAFGSTLQEVHWVLRLLMVVSAALCFICGTVLWTGKIPFSILKK